MKVVIAPDKFKECLSAAQVAQAIARGVLEVDPQAVIDLCPMADGGDGTVDAMVAATGGKLLAADVFDPLGAPLRAHFGLLGSSRAAGLPGELGFSAATAAAQGEGYVDEPYGRRTAVIEMAAASGLALVSTDKRDPMRTTTFGTGQLILAAIQAGASRIILGIGGSATVEGGCGCAQAIGVTFLDEHGEMMVCGMGGGSLASIGKVDMSGRDDRIAGTEILVACDVTNPLTGPQGAAAVFGPQKGATPEMVAQLDAGLKHLADVVRSQLGIEIDSLSGAGAAGGLGGGLVAFAGARLQRGVEIVADAVNLRRRIAGADLVITGEGRLDASSAFGKTAVGVARMAKEAGVPVVAIAGDATADAPRGEFTSVYSLSGPEVPPRQAIRFAAQLLQKHAAEAIRLHV